VPEQNSVIHANGNSNVKYIEVPSSGDEQNQVTSSNPLFYSGKRSLRKKPELYTFRRKARNDTQVASLNDGVAPTSNILHSTATAIPCEPIDHVVIPPGPIDSSPAIPQAPQLTHKRGKRIRTSEGDHDLDVRHTIKTNKRNLEVFGCLRAAA